LFRDRDPELEALQTIALLERLSAIGRAPRTPEEAAHWLAPILCTSARQQAILPVHLQAYAAESQLLQPEVDSNPPPLLNFPQIGSRPPSPWWRYPAIGFLALAFIFLFAHYFLTNRQPWLPAFTDSWQAIRDPAAWEQALRLFFALPIPLALVSPLTWLLWVRLRRQRQPVLNRKPYDGRAHATIQLAGSISQLFAGGELSWAMQGMRTHRRVPSLKPDARASARATAAACGCPVLVSGWRARLPDYPIIVEALSSRDHVVALARSLAARITTENVPHALYLFSMDLRWLRSDSDVPLTLGDLAAQYHQDVLVIIGDGNALLDPLFGKLRATVAEISDWNLVVLLTPVPRRRWSWRERRLAEEGVLVLPATPDGLRELGGFLRTEGRKPRPALERPPVRPGPLILEGRDALLWHSDRVPDEAEREMALDAIALELSPPTFDLVCVLALFPELRPDLTLFAAGFLRGPEGRRFCR
jgi:hypothetical protein